MNWKKKLSLSLAVVLSFFALIELAARIVEFRRPSRNVDYGLGFDADSVLFIKSDADERHRETHPAKRMDFCYQTFLAEKPSRTLRIAAVGGSSVRNLDPKFRMWEQRLASNLSPRFDRVEIINAGGNSYGTQRLVRIVVEVLDYAPDLVLVYSGHNEFVETAQATLFKPNMLALNRTLSGFAFLRLVRDRMTGYRIGRLRKELEADPTAKPMLLSDDVLTKEHVMSRMSAYSRNLTAMIEACGQRGVPIVMGTVPSNLVKPDRVLARDMEMHRQAEALFTAGNYDKAGALRRRHLRTATWRSQSSDLENAIVRSLAAKLRVPLADVERAVIEREPHGVPGETLFADHCHLNDRGNGIWIATYEPIILELFGTGRAQ